MNIRNEWNENTNIESGFYTKEEIISEVVANFNLRRNYSAEGKDVKINGVSEKCLVQTSSNPLNQLDDNRKLHCPISMVVNSGNYVEYENNIWMINTNVINVDDAYYTTRMSLCKYLLKWQNESNQTIERYIILNGKDNTNGEKDDKEFVISENQLSILIPFDTDTVELKEGKRFFVDNNPIKKSVYRLTKIDNTSHVLNGKGYISLVVTKDQFNDSVDRSDLELCDYTIPSPVTPIPTENHIKLDFKTTSLYVGGNYKTVTATVENTDGNVVLTSGFTWEVTSDISTKVVTSIDENVFKIKVIEDMDIIGKVIVVTAKNGTYEEQLKFEVKG